MSNLPAEDRGGASVGGTGAGRTALTLRKRILLSAFIVFHFICVVIWVCPVVHPARTSLLSFRLPLPTRYPNPVKKVEGWRFERLPVIGFYFGMTGQWQNWSVFLPNPITYFRHIGARVTFRSGEWREYTLPRLDQLGVVRAHFEARFREYQYAMTGPLLVQEDLARFFARFLHDPSDPPVHVDLYYCHTEIPRHDRPGRPPSTDYSRILRDPAQINRVPFLEYEVKPEDLR